MSVVIGTKYLLREAAQPVFKTAYQGLAVVDEQLSFRNGDVYSTGVYPPFDRSYTLVLCIAE